MQGHDPLTRHYDVLVIGGGSAGCVVASRLSEDRACRVGLIEAGSTAADPDIADPLKWPALQGRAYDWDYKTVPQPHTANRVHSWARGRVLGGSSTINAMAHVRGHPSNFDSWAEAGGKRWSYEGLLPGFTRSEDFSDASATGRGHGGPLAVYLPDAEINPVVRGYMAAGDALGVPHLGDHNGGELVGVAPNSLNIRDGRRVTTADAYLTPEVRARPNLALLLGHEVEQLSFSGQRASGVVAVHSGEVKTIEADRIVLCAGAIATPLLLMRSGFGDPQTLAAAGIACRNGLPEVGRNLQDHMLVLGNVYAARQTVPPSRLQHSESLMYLQSDDITRATGVPDIVLACVAAPSVSDQFAAPVYGSAFTILAGGTHPTSRGSITPGGPGRNDPPLIDPRYLETEFDRITLRKALEMARRIGGHEALDDWRSHEVYPGKTVASDAGLDAFIARSASTHHHPAGTCRMGLDDQAVVDGTLAVNGTAGLFIVDASIIPSLTSGPIHAAVIAIAETWSAGASALR